MSRRLTDAIWIRALRPEVLPFVEVTIVRAPEASGPVVDVQLEPADTRPLSADNDGAK